MPSPVDDFDLLIRAGRIVCPATGGDGPGAVGVRNGRIAAVERNPTRPARQVLEFPDGILLPGLIDLHGHPSCGESRWGIDPGASFLARGTTTVLSQGDAGPAECEAYVRETIEPSTTRVILAIEGNADVGACVAAIGRFGAHIWGVSINASHQSCGDADPREVVRRGLEIAEQTGRPILYGLRRPEDWPLEQQLLLLRPGDVVTYIYRGTPHCLLDEKTGRVLPCFHDARKRGVTFDLGHGRASFDFAVAEAALRDGFPPDTLSTDLQRGHLGQKPVHDLPLVMSKLRAAGMTEAAVFAAVTATPAKILGCAEEIGSLRSGTAADLTVLQWGPSAETLIDAKGKPRGGKRWEALAAFRAGAVTYPVKPV